MDRAFEDPTLRFLFEGHDIDFKQHTREVLKEILPHRPRHFSIANSSATSSTSLDASANTLALIRSLLHRQLVSYAQHKSTPTTLLSFYEVIATAHPALASVVANHMIAAGLISTFAQPSLLQRYPEWLNNANSGATVGAVALRELAADDGLSPLNTEARYDAAEKCFILRGAGKYAVVGGTYASYAIVSATLIIGKDESHGVHLFAVPLRGASQAPTDLSAVMMEPVLGEGDSFSSHGTSVIYFNHLKLKADHLLGPCTMDEKTGRVVSHDTEGESSLEVARHQMRLATASISIGVLKKQVRDAVTFTASQSISGPDGTRDYPYFGVQEVQSPLVEIVVNLCVHTLAWNQQINTLVHLSASKENGFRLKDATSSDRYARQMRLAGLIYGMQHILQDLEEFRHSFAYIHSTFRTTGAMDGIVALQLRQESKNTYDLISEVSHLSVEKNIGTTHWGWSVANFSSRFPVLHRFLQNPLYSPRMADLGRHYLFFSHKHFTLKKRIQRARSIETRRGGNEHAWHDWHTFRHREVHHCGEAYMEAFLLDVMMHELTKCSGDLRGRKLLRDMGWIYALARQAKHLGFLLFTKQLSQRKATVLLPQLDNISTVFAPQCVNVAAALIGSTTDRQCDVNVEGPCGSESYWTIFGAMTRPEHEDGVATRPSESDTEGDEELDLLHGMAKRHWEKK